MEDHERTVTEKGDRDTPACPAFVPQGGASRRQAKRLFGLTYTPNNPLVDRSFSEAKHSGVQARRREELESLTVSRDHPLSASFLKGVGI